MRVVVSGREIGTEKEHRVGSSVLSLGRVDVEQECDLSMERQRGVISFEVWLFILIFMPLSFFLCLLYPLIPSMGDMPLLKARQKETPSRS
jgi:hypothetical protein